MDSDKKPEEKTATPAGSGDTAPPSDALSKTNEELVDATSPTGAPASTTDSGKNAPTKQPNALKKILKRFNVYLLLFLLLAVIGAVVFAVSYLNSKKSPPAPSVASQTLSQSELKQLANSNATVGGSGQTLTVQGNAVFSGNVLVRSNLNVAGTVQLGGNLDVAQITASNSANLANTQISTLQVANTAIFQGLVTVQNGMNVAGNSSFSGAVSIGSLTVTNLTMSGNASLQVPNHISFPGAFPGRSVNFGVLGNGGSANISGSDTAGTVSINTGNNPTAGCFISIVFDVEYKSMPNIIIGPINAGAAQSQYYVGNRTQHGFSICTVNTPPANSAFAYSYFITD